MTYTYLLSTIRLRHACGPSRHAPSGSAFGYLQRVGNWLLIVPMTKERVCDKGSAVVAATATTATRRIDTMELFTNKNIHQVRRILRHLFSECIENRGF